MIPRLLNRLFWSGVDGRVYSAVRIGLALVALLNAASIWPDREALMSEVGFLDIESLAAQEGGSRLSIFAWATGPTEVTIVFLVSAGCMVLLLIGVWPRFAALVVFCWHLFLIEHIQLARTGWDLVLGAFSFLVLISPPGRKWSFSPRRRSRETEGLLPGYGITLMRLQVMVIYFQTVILKVESPYWRNGEFLGYYLLSHHARWPSPNLLEEGAILAIATWGALTAELAIPVLLFIRRTRHAGILLGFLLHGAISALSRDLGVFFAAMMMTYLCFLRTEDVKYIENWARQLTGR